MHTRITISFLYRSLLTAALLIGQAGPRAGAQTSTPQKAPGDRTEADILKELDAMKKRIEELEAELRAKANPDKPAATVAAGPMANTPTAPAMPGGQPLQTAALPAQQPTSAPEVNTKDPFAFADFTWLNGNPRTHESVLDTKYFTGEFRVDSSYIYDYNHPIDHSLDGTTEGTRTGEFQVQHLGVGGDFHAGNMQGRVLTQFGMYATATPRNDASPSIGQWELANAYRYVTEAWGGYHLNVQHGVNIQAGIFLSYIGLFSYYNFDNWTYQPSYVSSNTPWFFNGMRVQWFPTNKLKIEPWLINGWQSYGKFNGRMGVGGQILWRPNGYMDFVFNSYGVGQDTVGLHRTRYHEDDSFELKYFENPTKALDRMALSLTWDVGCENGAGVTCTGGKKGPAQNFLGFMFYNRWWFHHDLFGATIGGGAMDNPGRYLVLLPPIDGATASTGTPYFTTNPGDPFKAWDMQATFDYMPSEWVTLRAEFTHRAANVPYFTGPGGLTPPGGNTGNPTEIIPAWRPDLRKRENRWIFALLVKL
jgi:hypothetical protein